MLGVYQNPSLEPASLPIERVPSSTGLASTLDHLMQARCKEHHAEFDIEP